MMSHFLPNKNQLGCSLLVCCPWELDFQGIAEKMESNPTHFWMKSLDFPGRKMVWKFLVGCWKEQISAVFNRGKLRNVLKNSTGSNVQDHNPITILVDRSSCFQLAVVLASWKCPTGDAWNEPGDKYQSKDIQYIYICIYNRLEILNNLMNKLKSDK